MKSPPNYRCTRRRACGLFAYLASLARREWARLFGNKMNPDNLIVEARAKIVGGQRAGAQGD